MRNCSISEWLGERPDEPQLPLYAQVLGSQILDAHMLGAHMPETSGALAGIAFAQVRWKSRN